MNLSDEILSTIPILISTGKNLERENHISLYNDEGLFTDNNTTHSLNSPSDEQIDLAVINEYEHYFVAVALLSFIDKSSVCSFFVFLQR